MSYMDPAEARRLKSSLALLASPVDGEVLAAVGAAKRILEKNGLGFGDLGVRTMLPPPSAREESNPWGPSPRPFAGAPARLHQQQARRCLCSRFGAWKPHERKFLEQMAIQLRKPSEAQRDWLEGLVDRIARQSREAPDVDF